MRACCGAQGQARTNRPLMDDCAHAKLTLLRPRSDATVRCRHCHLTITAAELGAGHCPECFEQGGRRHRDFEPVPVKVEPIRFRCEDCGLIAEVASG